MNACWEHFRVLQQDTDLEDQSNFHFSRGRRLKPDCV